MQPVEPIRSRPAVPAPDLLCQPLGAFDRANLEAVRRAFQSTTPCLLGQAWLDETQADFSPATVRVGWRGDLFLVFAELADQDIFNRATALNQRTWELGDVFEIFLAPADHARYLEFHVTPGNQKLQLRYADGHAVARARKTGNFEEFLIPTEVFRSTTWIESHLKQWSVLAEIPASIVCDSNASLANARWRFSFSRYDYTRGAADPCISSTSPHVEPDFHRQNEWGALTFKTTS